MISLQFSLLLVAEMVIVQQEIIHLSVVAIKILLQEEQTENQQLVAANLILHNDGLQLEVVFKIHVAN